MANTRKPLGQVNPAANTATTLYTVPSATQTTTSTFVIANLGAATTYRFAIRPAGASLENKHYQAYDVPLNPNDAIYLTVGFTLAATDVFTVYAGTATVAFSLYGDEET